MLKFYAVVLVWFLSLAAGFWQYWDMKSSYQSELRRRDTALELLRGELDRTRANVLLAAKNAAESRTELSRAITEHKEWADAEVPSDVAAALGASRVQ